MKKISVIILAMLAVHFAHAQKSFYSGAFVFGANFGFDGNTTTQHFTNAPEGSAQTLNGTANASNFNMTAEVGLLNFIGLGLIGRVDNYTMQNNELTRTTPSVGSFDLGGTVNLHFIRMKHLDLLGGYDWGMSQIYYDLNDNANTKAYGGGTWSDIHATARFYFERFGFNLCLYVPTMTYSDIQNNNQSAGEYIVNYWKSTGYGASVGLQYRLL